MPTLLELVTSPVSLIVFALYTSLMVWERLAPGRPLPEIRHWRLKGLAFFCGYFLLSNYLPLVWDRYLVEFQLVDLTTLGEVQATVVGLLVYELCAWSYHRLLHATRLWRAHQTHHSAERLDTYGAFVFHPLDMVGWTVTASIALVVLVGVSPSATTNVLLLTAWMAMFQHANIKTPRWLGYIVQRPESHTVHHAMGMHHKNFADLPLIDMLFGTFENPDGYVHETGLYRGGSSRNLDLLLLRPVEGGRSQSVPELRAAQQPPTASCALDSSV